MLHGKRRIKLPLRFADWLRRARRASAPGVVRVLPLDAEVVIALDRLPSTFHGDPADRLIAATARAHRLPLATHDERIRESRAVRLWSAGRRETKPKHSELLEMRGKIPWEGDVNEMRTDRRSRR